MELNLRNFQKLIKKICITIFRLFIILFFVRLIFPPFNDTIENDIGVSPLISDLSLIDKNFYLDTSDLSVLPNYNYIENTLRSLSKDDTNSYYNVWHLDMMDGFLDGKFRYDDTGKNVNIILVDYFVDPHYDFSNRLKYLNPENINTFDEDTDTKLLHHGTSIAGTLGGSSYGIAKDSTIYHYSLPYQSTNSNYEIKKEDIHDLIKSTRDICTSQKKCVLLLPFVSNDYEYLGDIIKTQNFILVTAAGNEGIDTKYLTNSKESVNIKSNIITVGSYDLDVNKFSEMNVKKSSTSNYGRDVIIYAPGTDIITTGIDNQIISTSGTSIASAQVAGWIATILEFEPNYSIVDIKNIIKKIPLTEIKLDDNEIIPIRIIRSV